MVSMEGVEQFLGASPSLRRRVEKSGHFRGDQRQSVVCRQWLCHTARMRDLLMTSLCERTHRKGVGLWNGIGVNQQGFFWLWG